MCRILLSLLSGDLVEWAYDIVLDTVASTLLHDAHLRNRQKFYDCEENDVS
jgi:hypothetical protein